MLLTRQDVLLYSSELSSALKENVEGVKTRVPGRVWAITSIIQCTESS